MIAKRENVDTKRLLLIGGEWTLGVTRNAPAEVFGVVAKCLRNQKDYEVNFQSTIEGAIDASRKEVSDIVVLGYFDSVSGEMNSYLGEYYSQFCMTPDATQAYILDEIRGQKPGQSVILVTTAIRDDPNRPIYEFVENNHQNIEIIESPFHSKDLIKLIETP